MQKAQYLCRGRRFGRTRSDATTLCRTIDEHQNIERKDAEIQCPNAQVPALAQTLPTRLHVRGTEYGECLPWVTVYGYKMSMPMCFEMIFVGDCYQSRLLGEDDAEGQKCGDGTTKRNRE